MCEYADVQMNERMNKYKMIINKSVNQLKIAANLHICISAH